LHLSHGGPLGIATDIATGLGAPAAGAPPPGSPPRWAPVGPSAVVSAAHEPERVGCRLWGVGAAFWCPKWAVPLSRLFGGGLEGLRNPLKSVGSASGWCGVDHRHVPAKCARGYPRKRPGSTPNPESGSEIGIVTNSDSESEKVSGEWRRLILEAPMTTSRQRSCGCDGRCSGSWVWWSQVQLHTVNAGLTPKGRCLLAA
jgi:hypothetical protein